MKTNITEESKDVINQWYADADKQTIETLPDFMLHVLNDYGHDYGTIVHAITACSIAAAWAANNTKQGGITGFQAGALMWEFIRHWNHTNNKCGMKLIDYDNMLYPQYEKHFQKIISPKQWEGLQNEAKRNLENSSIAHPEVKAHWQRIVDGEIPFGYTINSYEP